MSFNELRNMRMIHDYVNGRNPFKRRLRIRKFENVHNATKSSAQFPDVVLG